MSDDSTQDQPIMSGANDATDDEKADGRDDQDRADAEFYDGKDATNAAQPEPDPATSVYVNPSSSDLSHQRDEE
jgi:hypothetical protein